MPYSQLSFCTALELSHVYTFLHTPLTLTRTHPHTPPHLWFTPLQYLFSSTDNYTPNDYYCSDTHVNKYARLNSEVRSEEQAGID